MISYLKSTNGRIHRINDAEEGCWINVINPSEDEISFLVSHYSLDPDFLRAAMDEEESSRIESEDDNTLIIVDAPLVVKSDNSITYETMPIGIIVTPRHVVTVCLRENPVISELADGMTKNIHTALKTQFVLNIMLRMSTRYLQYLKQIDKINDFVQQQLRKSTKNKELIQLLELEKSLVYFSTSLKSDEITMEKLMRGRFLRLYEEDQDLLEDVLIEIKQAIEMSNIYSSILSGTMDAFASIISNNLNIVMKVLAAVTILMSIPTIVSSFYGMNVDNLPFADFWFPVALSAGVVGIAALILIKMKMFSK